VILDWAAQASVLLTTLLIVFVPGVLALTGLGLRGLALVASAPLFSTLVVAACAVVAGWIGVAWTPLTCVVAVVVVSAIAWGLGRILGRRPYEPSTNRSRAILVGALVIAAVMTAWRLAAYVGAPDAISQTNDAVFHMNAVRFIIETGDASSLHVSSVIGGTGFYPAAWHAIVSLVVLCSGASIPVAANTVTLVIGAVIWPLGIAWLARLMSHSGAVAAYAAVLAGVMQNFPLLMFQWGVLFPNALSTALIPAAIGLVLVLPTWNREASRVQKVIRTVLVVLVAAGALAVSQPAALLPWGAICAVWLTFRLLTAASARPSWLRWASVLVVWVGLAAVWVVLSRSTSGSHWPFFRDRLEALLDIVVNSHVRFAPQIGISVLMLIGIVVVVRRGDLRWIAVSWAGISAVYWLVAAVGNKTVRDVVLGAWYADPYRIAAVVPVLVVPLAAIGVDALIRALSARMPGRTRAVVVSAVGTLAILAMILVLVRPTPLPSIVSQNYDYESRYASSEDTFLSDDERSLLEELEDLVEPGARVIGNPSTGSGFGYFFSGVDVYPRTWAPPSGPGWQVLAQGLRDAADDPAVCSALEEFGAPKYVLDFGLGSARPGRWEMPGMTEFEGQTGFQRIAEEGDASLWRITACDQ
jgi:hypothetical protein